MRNGALLLCFTMLAFQIPVGIALPVDSANQTIRAAGAARTASGLQQPGSQQQEVDIDSVAVVVNDDVITRNELNDRIREIVRQLNRQNTPLPAADVLEKQILERMIMDMLQLQYAKETGLRVDDTQLNVAIGRIAQQNNFSSLAQFRDRLEADGIDFDKFREEIRGEIISTRLREREIESKLVISDGEVDNYLANKARLGNSGEEFHLAHILVVIPEQASAEKIQAARSRAENALAQLKAGADFAQVAAGSSDANDALKGGDMGWLSGDKILPLFADELQNLKIGQVSGVLRSPSGFHIVKVIDKRGGNVPVVVTQTHVRHILIKTSEIVSDDEAKRQIMDIKQRIESGADFAKEAKRYSQDGSAQQGGDLDWISPGQTVPEFEEAMNKLKPGQMAVVQTQFGWHLVQVLQRRDADVGEQQKRQQARLAIGNFKSDEQFQDWLRQLRDRAFVEYHIEEKKSSN
jgi:peptidyl-prolyl cis-trans isomerase SurA